MTDTAGTRPGRRPWLDWGIVATFLLLPQSYVLFFSSSEFGASLLSRAPIFLVPAVLVAVRLARPHVRQPSAVDPVVVFLWVVVLAQGLIMGLIYTDYPTNVLSGYGQYAFWFALVAVFIGCVAQEAGLYVFDLMRRYFIAVSAIAWVFVALFLVFGTELPHRTVLMPAAGGDILLAQNYYLTVAYSGHSVLGADVPRFTFFYREPRILGVQLVMGLMLELGHLRGHWSALTGGQRWRGVAALSLMGGALFWTHSLHGYIFAACGAVAVGLAWSSQTWFWRRFRAVHVGILLGGVALLVAAFVVIGRRSDFQTLAELAVAQGYVGDPDVAPVTLYDIVGKGPALVAEYLTTYLSSPRGLLLFPLGRGIMNLDNERFLRVFGVSTTGGGTLLQVFAQNAGFVGVLAFGVIVWRLLGRMQRLVVAAPEWEVRHACLLGGFLLVVSTVYLDLVSMSAFTLLIFGAIMHLRLKT